MTGPVLVELVIGVTPVESKQDVYKNKMYRSPPETSKTSFTNDPSDQSGIPANGTKSPSLVVICSGNPS